MSNLTLTTFDWVPDAPGVMCATSVDTDQVPAP